MAHVENGRIDAYELRHILVQGENGSDTITFDLDPSVTGYTWRIRGTINGTSVESSAITPTETDDAVTVSWLVSSDFTDKSGIMYLTLVGNKSNGVITKAIGSVEILPDLSMASAPYVTRNLYEQLIESATQYAENSEAWSCGTRGGVAVGSSDPTYHNNAKYYSDHASTIQVGTVTAVSTNNVSVTNVGTEKNAVFNFGIPKGEAATVTVGEVETLPAGSEAYVHNVGNESNAVFDFGIPRGSGGGSSEGMIADPTTKSSGQYLQYDGSAWVAESIPSSFNNTRLWYNSQTGSGATYPAQTQPINGTGYKAYLVVFRQTANGGAYASFVYPIGATFSLAAISLGWGNTVQYKRLISSATESQIVFSNGKTSTNGGGSNTDSSSAMIPAYVYGIK